MDLSAAEQAALDAARGRDAELRGDRERRKRDGIVHTPPELARFCARAADELLVRELGVTRGLADGAVHVVDPACGPGAFLAAALQVASAHGRIEAKLTGLDRDDGALGRARGVVGGDAHVSFRHVDTLRDESLHLALADGAPTLVILGNPPWATRAATSTERMRRLLADFHADMDGAPLREKKLGVLSDLYVRFFRWCIELACASRGGAVVALVTNDSFLDGPVHRGMRAMLLRTFDAVEVIALGGNALLGRAKGTGVRDDNVFGVRPGVAITLLVRKPGAHLRQPAPVRATRIFGTTAQKLETLAQANLPELAATAFVPSAPHFRWIPGRAPSAEYTRFVSLSECMPFHREGVQSNRDALAVAKSRDELMQRLTELAFGPAALLGDRLAHYDPALARAKLVHALAADPHGERGISARRLAYRPFDDRWFSPVTPLCHRPRPELLAAFDHRPLALVAVRKDRGSAPYEHFGASTLPVDNCFLSTRSSCRARAFPVCTPSGGDNLSAQVREALSRVADAPVDASTFVAYALCILASPTYRARYEHELRIDYPRIPMPTTHAQLDACLRAGTKVLEVLTRHQRVDAALESEPLDSEARSMRAIAECDEAAVALLAASSS